MATYWDKHERGFVNECGLVRAMTAQDAQDLEDMGYERLTWEQVRAHIRHVNANLWSGQRPISPRDVRESQEYDAALILGWH